MRIPLLLPFLALALALVLLPCACAGPAPARTLVVAHRGAAAVAPENTVAAVRKAIELRADQVELDVRLTTDGVVVLLHDDAVDRTTDGTGALASFSLARTRALDAGRWFAPSFANERIPTLAEVAAVAKGHVGLMLDLKVVGAGEGIAAALAETGFPPSRILIGAWNDAELADARRFNPDARMLYIGEVPEGAADTAWLEALAAKGYSALSLGWKRVTPAVVARTHALGLALYVWTLNDPADMAAAVAAGVDGVITDRPADLWDVLDAR